jgi:hypothetical protein
METSDISRTVFVTAYVTTALYEIGDHCGIAADCDGDCNGDHQPVQLTRDHLSEETCAVLERDAGEFFDAHAADLALYPGEHGYDPDQWAERGGYRFWMERSGHGVGFFDWYVSDGRDKESEAAVYAARERLSAAAHAEGERDMFMDADGMITHGKSWGEHQRERNGS